VQKEHQLPLHHATSVLALSILSPLPSQRFLERSTRCPACPAAVSSGSDKRRTRRAGHRRQERPRGKRAVGRTFPSCDHTPHAVVAFGHRAASAGGRTREAHVPTRSLVPVKTRIREQIAWHGLRWCARRCGERRGASLRRRLHMSCSPPPKCGLPVLEYAHPDWLQMRTTIATNGSCNKYLRI
jgi:hypothetical protein